MTSSSRLIWPVASPWALVRRGTPTAYLSSRQRTLLIYLHGSMHKGPRTLEEIARVVGVTSRGQVSRELRRLRQLELVGVSARKGRNGRHYLWLNPAARRLRTGLRRTRLPRGNDSASTPFGGFISRIGVESAWRKGGGPPLAGRSRRGEGPRRGREPPRTLHARCPAGHRTTLGRRSWMAAPGTLVATWTGICGRCQAPVRERVELTLPPPPPREPSPAELADPALLERRRAMAVAMLEDPATSPAVRERITRDYLEDPAGRTPPATSSTPSSGGPRRGGLADSIDKIRRRPE
jgi:DNA-binding transcriptional ArsR family regulator